MWTRAVLRGVASDGKWPRPMETEGGVSAWLRKIPDRESAENPTIASRFTPPDRRPPATKWPSDSIMPVRAGPGGINSGIAGVAYVQRVETISDCICNCANHRDSVFAGGDICPQCRGDGRQNDSGRGGTGIEKVGAVSPRQLPDSKNRIPRVPSNAWEARVLAAARAMACGRR